MSDQFIKTVDFSSVVIFHSIRPIEDDIAQIWYNQEDKVRFTHNVARDAAISIRMMSRKIVLLNSDVDEPISEEELAECVGLENILSGNMRHIMEMKRRHAWVVFREQALQRVANARSEERLADLASASSRWSRERSHSIAVRYMAS
jgi:hypothetical protein